MRALLASALGLRAAECRYAGASVPLLMAGAVALVIVPPGHPLAAGAEQPGVHHIALAVADPLAVAGDLAAGPARPGLDVLVEVALAPAATAGVRSVLTAPPRFTQAPAPLIEQLDHIGIASADNDAAIAIFHDRLGLPIESRQTDMEVTLAVESFTSDKYGVVYHTRPPVPVGGLRVAFLGAGDCDLELL